MKHAFLIMAHNNFYVLKKLLQQIDDVRNDIFIHIDAKCTLFNAEEWVRELKFSQIYFVDRVDVIWGAVPNSCRIIVV